MITKNKTLFLIVIFLLCRAAIHAQNGQALFKKLFLLAGTWRMETKKGMLFENWEIVNDSTLLGKSYRVSNNDTTLLETMSFSIRNDEIMFIAVANGQNNNTSVGFRLRSAEKDIYIFENPDHDFPQRVIYELPKDNSLHAWIEGNSQGQLKRSDYYYSKLQ
jgi:uncharacterized membrane protein YciS (DUF1049 family)